MKVVLSDEVVRELKLIFNYNAQHRGESQAIKYEKFLFTGLRKLSATYDRGKNVEGHPGWKYVSLKVKSGKDGHVAVFRVDQEEEEVLVVHIFHTKQNWINRI